MVRHIYYHGYHTKVKCLGANLIEKLALQGCQLDPHTRNSVPELSEPLICNWADCKIEFVNVQHFYWHIHSHAESPTGEKEWKCLWEGCKFSCSSKFKLRDHFKVHSQERPLACPTCGSLFVSRTKLHDHCLRQLPLDGKNDPCCVPFHRLIFLFCCSKRVPLLRVQQAASNGATSPGACPIPPFSVHVPTLPDRRGREWPELFQHPLALFPRCVLPQRGAAFPLPALGLLLQCQIADGSEQTLGGPRQLLLVRLRSGWLRFHGQELLHAPETRPQSTRREHGPPVRVPRLSAAVPQLYLPQGPSGKHP